MNRGVKEEKNPQLWHHSFIHYTTSWLFLNQSNTLVLHVRRKYLCIYVYVWHTAGDARRSVCGPRSLHGIQHDTWNCRGDVTTFLDDTLYRNKIFQIFHPRYFVYISNWRCKQGCLVTSTQKRRGWGSDYSRGRFSNRFVHLMPRLIHI